MIIIYFHIEILHEYNEIKNKIHVRKGCIGFEKLHYKDHDFTLTYTQGHLKLPNNDPNHPLGNNFELRVQNGAGDTLHLRTVDIEYPEGVHVTWSEHGYDCDDYNSAGDTTSGCRQQNVSEAEITTLKILDIGKGHKKLRNGDVYKLKVEIDYLCWTTCYPEKAICSGTINNYFSPHIQVLRSLYAWGRNCTTLEFIILIVFISLLIVYPLYSLTFLIKRLMMKNVKNEEPTDVNTSGE